MDYWETVLRLEVDPRSSLSYFKPCYMSITTSHPLFKTAGSSPSKVAMATVQATMISGRYRTEALCRHLSSNKRVCLLSRTCSDMLEDVDHIIRLCSALHPTREKLMSFTVEYSSKMPNELKTLLLNLCSPPYSQNFCNILLTRDYIRVSNPWLNCP